MMPIGFQNRKPPSARPTCDGSASATASAPDWLSTIARQTPFSANRTTTTASQTPLGTRGKATVARASTPSDTTRNGLCRPIRSDQIPTTNCTSAPSAASVEMIPMSRSDSPRSFRYSGRYGSVNPIPAIAQK